MNIAFICTGNSCRSQMAEGWCRALAPPDWQVYSAGTHPGLLNPLAVRAMSEHGIDISEHTSSHVDDLRDKNIVVMVTVCDRAAADCPIWCGSTRCIHQPFDDPPALAALNPGDEMQPYRRVCFEIRSFIQSLIAEGTTP